MKSQLTVGKKLMISFGIMLALTLGLAYSSLTSISSLSADLNTAVNSSAKKLDGSAQLTIDTSDMFSLERGMAVRAITNETAIVEKYRRDFERLASEAEKDIKDILPLLTTDAGRRAAETAQTGLADSFNISRRRIAT